jgi:hypothetical protein
LKHGNEFNISGTKKKIIDSVMKQEPSRDSAAIVQVQLHFQQSSLACCLPSFCFRPTARRFSSVSQQLMSTLVFGHVVGREEQSGVEIAVLW